MAYLERVGSEIVGVNVSRRLCVPLEMLEMAMLLDGQPYRMHPNGGGLVAASSYVSDRVVIPQSMTIGPDTHVLTSMGMAGQFFIQGNFTNPNQVSQRIGEDGFKLLEEQRELGVMGRVIDIERRRQMARAAAMVESWG